MKKYIVILFGFMIVGFGCALTIKANVGMGAWDAFAKSFSDIIGIEVGTAGIIFNCMCVIGQLILLRKNFTFQHLLQVPFCMVLGVIVNFAASTVFMARDSFISFSEYDMCTWGIYGNADQ